MRHDGAVEEARKAAAQAGVEVRPLASLEDFDRALEVMRVTWGRGDLVSRELLRAFQAAGSVFLGAFAGGGMVGYVLGFYGTAGGLHLHSHMLAVVPGWQSRGVGAALKLAQRATALEGGVRTARWTFDPLSARNAHFNLHKLGAVADRFHRHLYGDMEDVLNRGDRSDRLEARWDLDVQRGRPPWSVPAAEVLGLAGPEDAPRPTAVRPPAEAMAVVRVPRDYPALRDRDPGLAAAWRDASAEALEACFGAGMTAVDFREGAYLFRATS